MTGKRGLPWGSHWLAILSGILVVIAVALYGVFVWVADNKQAAPVDDALPTGSKIRSTPASVTFPGMASDVSGASYSQSDPAPSAHTPTQPALDLEQLATHLAQLEIDANGEVKLDKNALAALNAAFLRPVEPLDNEQVAQLQQLVSAGLEGAAGEQAAAVIQRFSRYSRAYREVQSSLQGHQGRPHVLENYLGQLHRLRRAHLGDELAEALYGREEELTRLTITSMRLSRDPSLSEKELHQRREEISRQVEQLLPDDGTSAP